MTQPNATAAQLLELSVSGYASAAAARLIDEHESIAGRYGGSAFASWKANYVQRLLELAAALRVGAPTAFTSRVLWQYRAFAARELDAEDVPRALASLRATLLEELPDEHGRSAAGYIDDARAALEEGVAPDRSELDPTEPSGALVLSYLAACLEGNPRKAIELVVEASASRDALMAIYLDVIFPALREIGRMWHNAEASVAEERLVSETTRRLMTLLTHERLGPQDVDKTVVSAAVAGNAHDLGLRAVADFFDVAGWRSLCLGADVPVPDVAAASRFFDADLIVLAMSMTTQIRTLEASIEAVRTVSGEGVKILIGGGGLAEVPEVWRDIGADGYAVASDAVEVGARLVGIAAPG